MKTLLAKLRQAETASPPEQLDDEILDGIQTLSDDVEEVSAFLKNMLYYSEDRTASYLSHLKVKFPKKFSQLKRAMEEMEEDEDEEMEEEELPTEMGVEDEDEMPMRDEEEEEEPEAGMREYQEEDEEMMEEEMPEEGQMEEEEEPVQAIEEDEDEDEEPAVEPVVDVDALEEEDREAAVQLDMVLFNSDNNPHWSVFADGKPLAEIRLEDQENAEQIADIFTSDDYPEHVQEAAASSMGIKATLNSLRARWYHGVADHGTIATAAKEAAVQKLEDEFATRLASLKEDLLNTINLAIMASNKGNRGFLVKNPLKQAVVDAYRSAGVVTSGQIANELWVEASQNYFSEILKVAEKWLSFSPEAMREITAEILEADPEAIDEEEIPSIEAPLVEDLQQEQAKQATAGIVNVPIKTQRVAAHSDGYKQAQADRMGLASMLSRRAHRSK